MYIDLQALDGAARHKVLSTIVVPRPIAWISSMDEHGAVNVAPFSFFNLLSADPPLFCVGIGARDGMPKDTARNIRARGEFTVNMVSAALARRMNVTAIEFPAGVNEAQEAGLMLAPGIEVATPRIAQSPASFECRVRHLLNVDGLRTLVVADIVAMHVMDEAVLDPGQLYLDTPRMDLVGRLHNPGWYCRTGPAFQMPQLSLQQWDGLRQGGEAEPYLVGGP
ncbi:flavin reductase family protein [Cupriavidus sp. UME77]|uniref:flavin reductase family protein n=1 Tax=Cupriavidus sp. UME77 TaxID=1862321 RepID=UPI0016014204|nr:flavin reductase family protein [Cupriavidus sp. UME77]MBB1632647.1 hypothetical protein [Cupriavidus sp. UME77]